MVRFKKELGEKINMFLIIVGVIVLTLVVLLLLLPLIVSINLYNAWYWSGIKDIYKKVFLVEDKK